MAAQQLHPGFAKNLKIIVGMMLLVIVGGAMGFKMMQRQQLSLTQMDILSMDVQGGVPATETPHYTEALARVNQQGLAQAQKTNHTFIPGLSDRLGKVEAELPRQQPESPAIDHESPQPLPPLPAPSPGITQQVQTLIATWDNPPQAQQVLGLQEQASSTTELSSTVSSMTNQPTSATQPTKQPILKAAEKYYAHLENGIDTDAPSDVLAILDQGPCQGGRLMGSGKLMNEAVTAMFTTLSCQGRTLSVNAVALNDETLTNALPARINHRYAQRIGIPALLGGLGAAGSVYNHAGSTVTQSPLGGYTEVTNPNPSLKQITGAMATGGVQATQNVIQQQASNIPPIRGRVTANLPVLILFKSDVFLE